MAATYFCKHGAGAIRCKKCLDEVAEIRKNCYHEWRFYPWYERTYSNLFTPEQKSDCEGDMICDKCGVAKVEMKIFGKKIEVLIAAKRAQM